VCYANAANSNIEYNYTLNGIIGNEMDGTSSPLAVESGLTEYNYSTRNQYGTGVDAEEGQVGFFEGLFGSTGASGNGNIVEFNVVDGTAAHSYKTFIGEANGYTGTNG